MLNRNDNPNFGAPIGPASYFESRTDVFRPIAHSAKTPVRIALFLHGFGIDSTAVVANEHSQEIAEVLNFNFDPGRLGMT